MFQVCVHCNALMWDSRWSCVGCSARCLDSACPVCGLNLLQFQLMLLEVVPLGLMQLRAGSCSIAQIAQGSEFQMHGERRASITCQSARVVKGVDLRSTAGNCAWVRTPQLTFKHLELQPAIVRVCGLGYAASRPNCRWCVYRQALA